MKWWLLLLLPAMLWSQSELRGRLDPVLFVPAPTHLVSSFQLGVGGPRDYPGLGLANTDQVFAGTVRRAAALIVERVGAIPRLFVDLNRDGRMNAAEEQVLKIASDKLLAGVATVQFPLAGPGPRLYPVLVYVYRKQNDAASRMVGESPSAFLRGTVPLVNRSLLVQYEFDDKQGRADPRRGWQGMDSDGNGQIDRDPSSMESVLADQEPVVFRVGEQYISTKQIDLAQGEVVLQTHPPADYARIELRPGVMVPDFPYTDLLGQPRRLGEFAAQWVLLDF